MHGVRPSVVSILYNIDNRLTEHGILTFTHNLKKVPQSLKALYIIQHRCQ